MGFLEDRDLSLVPTIPEYYRGKTVFITGGSGFVGKVLIEKLLYSCTELERIYLLMRSRKGASAESRLRKLYSSECFNRLKVERPGVFETKVYALAGDMSLDGLGLSEQDRCLLVEQVNIIFHSAASVRFDDHLSYAVNLNLRGTLRVIDLAKQTKNLSAYVHVSTTYSNTAHGRVVEEAVYSALADWRDTLKICDNLDSHTIEVLTNKYLNGMPNPYAFTKQLAECALYENKGQLPVAILRPSIVVAALVEPSPGWIDNFNGPMGLSVGYEKGIIHSLFSKSDVKCDYICVDSCVRNIIAVSWIRGTKPLEATDDIPVYNSCATDQVKITMSEMINYGHKWSREIPLDNVIWPSGEPTLTTSRFRHYLTVLVMQILPALVVDSILHLSGRKPRLLNIQRKVYRAMHALEYYMTNDWTFKNTNSLSLCSRLKDKDKCDFYYNMKGNDLDKYFEKAALAIRRYLLHEKDEDIPKAKAHKQRLQWLDKIVKALLCVFIYKWLYHTFLFN